MRAPASLRIVTFLGSLFAASGGCNSGTGDCPAKEAITAGAACTDEHLQCAYDLPSPSVACDGTSTVLATSCICTKGLWDCPSAVTCPGSGATGDDAAAGDDGPPGDDGPAEGDDGTGDDGASAGDGATDASDSG